MTFSTRPRLYAAAAAALLLAAAPALAQSAPPLASMPMPPSARDPAPKETKKAQPRKTGQSRARTEDDPTSGEPAARRAPTTAASGTQKPSRYVPEEFDRGGAQEGSRAKPYMSESGRPGMGMRF